MSEGGRKSLFLMAADGTFSALVFPPILSYGFFSRLWGMASDALLNATIVTADAKVL